jgi:very-short-patch-repair endonuclease
MGRLAIEFDGKEYHSLRAQKALDWKKGAYLRKRGYKVMRISGSSIVNCIP